MNKELLQQTLDALNDSLDCVATEYSIYLESYDSYPSHKAEIDMLKIGVEKHKAAIKALEVAIAQPEQPALPSCYSDDADAFIEKHLALRNYPSNSRNAARAGWDAACDLLYNIAQPEQTANLETYIAANYPDAKGETIFERCIDSLETMDKALGYASIAQPMPATSAKPAQGDAKDAEQTILENTQVIRDIGEILNQNGWSLSGQKLQEAALAIERAAIASQKGAV